MNRVGVLAFCLPACLVLSCGSGRQLQSIAISQALSGGKVQFTATGTYSAAPATVTPLAVSWGIGPFAPPPPPNIDMHARRALCIVNYNAGQISYSAAPPPQPLCFHHPRGVEGNVSPS
jgi:hypothetical protein